MAKVYYYIPEDGDEEDHPNVFMLGKQLKDGSAELGQIKAQFPLPGAYHFRFKRSFKNTFVWMDLTDDREHAPLFEGKIMCKVSRLQSTSSNTANTERETQKTKSSPLPAPSSDDLLGLHSEVSPPVVQPSRNTNGSSAVPLLDPMQNSQSTAAQRLHSFHPAPMQAVKLNPSMPHTSAMGNMAPSVMQPTPQGMGGVHRTISTGSIPNPLGATGWNTSPGLSSSPVRSSTPGGGAFRSTSASAKSNNTQSAAELHQSMSDAANNFKL